MPPESQRSAAVRFPKLDACARVMDFDPQSATLRDDVLAIAERVAREGARPDVTVVAPYFMLHQADLCAGVSQQPQLRFFANNYAAQGVKLKHCKRVLNRAYGVLAHLGAEALEQCSFLERLACLYLVDLSFIPEKYRLDADRAGQIVNRCLTRWLRTLVASLPAASVPPSASGAGAP
jgi:ATP-dependent Lon protease